jgi:hypothetical protein
LDTLADLETDYKTHIETLDGDFDALEPTYALSFLVHRIGQSVESWNEAWGHLEAMDKEGLPLVPSQLYVMIAALKSLPSQAKLSGSIPDRNTTTVRSLCCCRFAE